jgi:hypothetical protein
MKSLLLILILFTNGYFLTGQPAGNIYRSKDSCDSLLNGAERSFKDGLYERCIGDLNSLIRYCSLSKGAKERAMELLSKAYIETESLKKADSAVNRMLIRFPHYELKESDNPEGYNRLVKKYRIHPMLSIGARNTAKWLNYKQTKVYSVLDGLDYSSPYTTVSFGFIYYGWGELEFNNGISLNGDLTFWWARYDRNIKKPPSFNLQFWEIDHYMNIPVYVKKYFYIGKNVLPYVATGIGWQYIMTAYGNAVISYTKDDLVTGKNADYVNGESNINMLGMRKKNTFDWLAGVGIGYKLKNLRLFFDIRYCGALNSITDPSKRLNNPTLINDYFYIDNSVKLNQFEIGASISYTLINSVKKKKY